VLQESDDDDGPAIVRIRPRPPGSYDPLPTDIEVWTEFINNPVIRGEIDAIERRYKRSNAGRRPKYPLITIVALQLLADNVPSKRHATRIFTDHWPALRELFAAHYHGYEGLEPGSAGPNWRHLPRYLRRHGLTHDVLSDLLLAVALRYADELGIGTQSNGGSRTHPHITDIVAGDGTGVRPLFNSPPGTLKVHPLTGEIVEARHDPDVGTHRVGDKMVVNTTQFVSLLGTTGEPNGMFVFDTQYNPAGKDNGEAALGVEMMQRLVEELPGLRAVAWDKIMRGKHMDAFYKMGLMPVVRGHGEDESLLALGITHAECTDGTRREVTLYAYKHDLCYVGIAGDGSQVIVPIPTNEIKRKKANADGTYPWYRLGVIPDAPAVPRRLRGAKVRVRLDNTEADARDGRNRAENLRAHGPETVEFQRLYGPRELTESWHAWLKRNLCNDRARSVGALMQHFDMVCAALHRNIVTVLMHRRRQRLAGSEPLAA